MTPKVSIVIPVYNAERYIEKCARTLFGQTLDALEYIFVDDCSPDYSIDVMRQVLENFPERKDQVKVVRHETNKGVSQARQDGVDAATGEYIIHCDPDDWVELNMYEEMYRKAKETGAEMVICDYTNFKDGGPISTPPPETIVIQWIIYINEHMRSIVPQVAWQPVEQVDFINLLHICKIPDRCKLL